MALVECPECGHAISEKAKMCPNCGHPIGGGPLCWEYRSETTYFGLPLVHIVYGLAWDPTTGKPRVAKDFRIEYLGRNLRQGDGDGLPFMRHIWDDVRQEKPFPGKPAEDQQRE